jgi:hypothetical protein
MSAAAAARADEAMVELREACKRLQARTVTVEEAHKAYQKLQAPNVGLLAILRTEVRGSDSGAAIFKSGVYGDMSGDQLLKTFKQELRARNKDIVGATGVF